MHKSVGSVKSEGNYVETQSSEFRNPGNRELNLAVKWPTLTDGNSATRASWEVRLENLQEVRVLARMREYGDGP